ncbi:ArsR family transcriptional regulator [Leifsonia sp. Root227]|jgi:DNA-binding IclR family transcriptional regulator|uniref:IclR family transcriptional regulator n=1 Tax=unclassified Leifsonia TaxID=2663824 RepID=UPI0006F1CE93|nr:helix-turn-helix domain-containing protein [Leifsonia sp. Root227]KRC52103.1 ArsR family transcriptional regulator [Leifsonia sp. Root227]
MTNTVGGQAGRSAENRADGGSQTLARGLSALAMIGEDGASLSVPELAGRLGIHRSMAYRLVKTLEQHGFVERSPSGELELGARLASLARGAARSLQTAASPELAAVADELGMTAFLVGYDGEVAVTLTSAEPRHAETTVAQRPGSRHAIGQGAPGRVIRSLLSPEQYPPQRFERSHDEVLPGLYSIAVPLALPHGRAAAIAVLYLPHPLDEEHVADVLVAAARRIDAAFR